MAQGNFFFLFKKFIEKINVSFILLKGSKARNVKAWKRKVKLLSRESDIFKIRATEKKINKKK